jgi:hypothetical protein
MEYDWSSCLSIGHQPVRVLENAVLQWFEDKYPQFRAVLEQAGRSHGLDRHIRYYCDKEPVRAAFSSTTLTPFIDSRHRQICLFETFNSLLWAVSYATMIIFDEQVHGPRIAEEPAHGYGIGHFLDRAYRVYTFGLSLITKYSDWPINTLPNPLRYTEEDRFYVERANGIYVSAVDFIICHELAHATLGHLRLSPTSRFEIRQLENEADQSAFACLRISTEHNRPLTNAAFGAIAGLGACLLLSDHLSSTTHPDTDGRILAALQTLRVDAIHNLWGVASVPLLLWCSAHAPSIVLDGGYDTYGDMFVALLKKLEPLKTQEEIARIQEAT